VGEDLVGANHGADSAGEAPTGQAQLTSSLVRGGDDHAGLLWLVLGDAAGSCARVREHAKDLGVEVSRGGDNGRGDRLGNSGLAARGLGDAGSVVLIRGIEGQLSLLADLSHHFNALDGPLALGSLAGKHDAIGTLANGVCDVGHLGASRAGVDNHGLKHLGGRDDRLADGIALLDDHLLGHVDLLDGDLDTEVAAGNHDAVRHLEDLVEVVQALLRLDLGEDHDPAAGEAQNLADLLDVVGLSAWWSACHSPIIMQSRSTHLSEHCPAWRAERVGKGVAQRAIMASIPAMKCKSISE
jgi:hypothetical protein